MRTIIPPDAKLIPENAQRVFKGKIFDVYQWQQEMFDGSFEIFEMLKRPDTIKVIAIKDNQIVIIQEQQPNTDTFIDVPSGRHDVESENELQAAQRELLEETGMTFQNWKLIKIEQPYNKMDWFVYFFIATDFVSQTDQKLDTGEKISISLESFVNVIELANDPKSRYLPLDVLRKAGSIEGLVNFPEYTI